MSPTAPGTAGGRAPTIYDIAERAGVSPSTVSRALHKPGRISAQLAERIRAVADDLNYQPNPMARALPTGRSGTMGLVVTDITNPVYSEIVRGAEHGASTLGYTLMLVESEESAELELIAAERLLQTSDGVLFGATRLAHRQLVNLSERRPVVAINRRVQGIPSIVADVDTGIGEAMRHLSAFGHRTVGYLAGPAQSWMSARRRAAIQQRAGWCRIDLLDLGSFPPTVEGGRSAAAVVFASEATAVFAFNDLIAIGLMQELALAGVEVPRDVSVVGFDDIFGSDFTTPPLTTIKAPLREAGQLAARVLHGEVTGAAAPWHEVVGAAPLPTRLIVRGSVAVARARTAF